MAYNCYFACDRCGDGYSWTGQTVSRTQAERNARRRGWKVGKTGWFCPECQKNMKKDK